MCAYHYITLHHVYRLWLYALYTHVDMAYSTWQMNEPKPKRQRMDTSDGVPKDLVSDVYRHTREHEKEAIMHNVTC